MQKSQRIACLSASALICLLTFQTAANAAGKIVVILRTQEGMQEHTSDEPRRLVHDVLTREFGKGNVVQVVDEKSPSKIKDKSAPYKLSANLIAFSFKPNTPMHVSLSMQLLRENTKEILLKSDRALVVDEKAVESGLKLHKNEFDNSNYGKMLTELSPLGSEEI